MSIWKTPDAKPDVFKPHRILVIYEAHDEPELMFSPQYDTLTDHRYVNRWCYLDDLMAAADRAERLQDKFDTAWVALKILTEKTAEPIAASFAKSILEKKSANQTIKRIQNDQTRI